jgi:acetoin utilization protein AcuB
MVVEQIMSPDPFAVEVSDSVGKVMNELAEADVRHLPVVEDGELVGIVSDRDLRAFVPTAMVELEHPHEVRERLGQPISNVMSSNVVSVNPETDVSEVVDVMLEQKIGAVPVVEADSAKLIGIVSYTDILRAARELL